MQLLISPSLVDCAILTVGTLCSDDGQTAYRIRTHISTTKNSLILPLPLPVLRVFRTDGHLLSKQEGRSGK